MIQDEYINAATRYLNTTCNARAGKVSLCPTAMHTYNLSTPSLPPSRPHLMTHSSIANLSLSHPPYQKNKAGAGPNARLANANTLIPHP